MKTLAEKIWRLCSMFGIKMHYNLRSTAVAWLVCWIDCVVFPTRQCSILDINLERKEKFKAVSNCFWMWREKFNVKQAIRTQQAEVSCVMANLF